MAAFAVRYGHGTPALTLILVSCLFLSMPSRALTVESEKAYLVVYIVENPSLTRKRPTIGETLIIPEMAKRKYKVLPSLRGPDLASLCPRDVRGVWNDDRRKTFMQYYGAAEILWMAQIDYGSEELSRRTGSRDRTVSVAARAYATNTGKSLWYGRVADHPLRGTGLAEAAAQALGEVLPALVDRFDRDPRVRAWLSANRRSPPWPRDIPLLTPKPGPTRRPTAEDRQMRPRPPHEPSHTGVVVEADHLRVRPSYRTGLYSSRGRPVYVPRRQRIHWADSALSARTKAGAHPLRLKAYRSEGDRIVLRENDIRKLRRESHLLERGNVTIIVRPPRR